MKNLIATFLCVTALFAAASAQATTPPTIKRSTLIERLDTCEAILQDLQSSTKTAIPAAVFRQARAIVIVNQVQAGFLFGVKDGYAVAMVRRPNGQWSLPTFFNTGEASLGLQVGIKAINTVMVIMDDATAKLLTKHKINFGAEAKAAAGVRAAEAEGVTKPITGDANVYVYSLQEGYYLGLAVKTGYLAADETSNKTFYNTKYNTPEILYSDWVEAPPEVAYIRNYVTRLSQ